jgi:dTDP-4-dehydrorhamnose reductase
MMARSMLIFGGGGFVGGNLAAIANQKGWEVIVANQTIKPGLDFANWIPLDITNMEAVQEAIDQVTPVVVVNLAAKADIDIAERERQQTWKINVDGARNVAQCCAMAGIRHIYFSSDAVFSGEQDRYAEESLPAPLNFYGQTKAEAEKAVLAVHPKSVVVRISLVLGFPVTGGNSFFAGLTAKLKTGAQIFVPEGEIRTPVDVITLSECVLELAENDFSGIIHIGSTDSMDRYSLTRKIVQKMGYDQDMVVPADTSMTQPDRALRHKNGVLEVAKAQDLLAVKLLGVNEGVLRAFYDRISPVEV